MFPQKGRQTRPPEGASVFLFPPRRPEACTVTGQAAGVAAAVSIQQKRRTRGPEADPVAKGAEAEVSFLVVLVEK